MELLVDMCPNALGEVICLWLPTNKSATYGLVEQLIFGKIQQNVSSFKAPMQTDTVAEGARHKLEQTCEYQPCEPD